MAQTASSNFNFWARLSVVVFVLPSALNSQEGIEAQEITQRTEKKSKNVFTKQEHIFIYKPLV
jgi:hypothetical protein